MKPNNPAGGTSTKTEFCDECQEPIRFPRIMMGRKVNGVDVWYCNYDCLSNKLVNLEGRKLVYQALHGRRFHKEKKKKAGDPGFGE